jgi:hypothetical protein
MICLLIARQILYTLNQLATQNLNHYSFTEVFLSGEVQTEKSRSGQMYMTWGQVENPKPLKQRKAMDISIAPT